MKNIVYDDPLVYTINNFVDNNTIKHIINTCRPKMKAALVSDSKQGVVSNGRTNTNCWIKHNHDEIFLNLATKVASIVNMPLDNAEAFQVIHYDKDQEYKQHYDGWDFDGSEKSRRNMKFGGQRICTALCYLNDVEEGGGTKFTKINKEVNAEKGKLLVFYNVYHKTNIRHELSEHAGMPVIKGDKWAFNLWFRQQTRIIEFVYPEIKVKEEPSMKEEANSELYNSSDDQHYKDANTEINIYNNVFSMDELINVLSSCSFEDKDKAIIWRDNKFIPTIIKKLNNILNIDTSYLENICITKYKAGIQHNCHQDAHDLTNEIGIKHTQIRGQRLMTITGFITSVKVIFAKLDKTFICDPGSIIVYNNCLNNSSTRNNNLSKKFVSCNNETNMVLFSLYMRERCKETTKYLKYNNFNFEYYEPLILDYETITNNIYNKSLQENLSYKNFGLVNKAPMNYTITTISKIKEIKDTKEFLNSENLEVSYKFDEYNPVIVENVVNSDIHKIIDKYFKENIKNNVYPLGDRQANRYKIIDEIMTRLLHLEILPLIEKITNKKLDPTYTYLSAYLKGTDLHAHTDRPECEFTVSYIIGKPPGSNWNIYLHKKKQPVKFKGRYEETPPKEECIPVDCEENGLMIFSGTDHIHYRETLEHEYYNIVLLHYKSKKEI
tara:strand:+ start:392 stop:2386 length:1995 start_codon:yes stop_codon:yes gene_type:complete